VQNQAHDNQRVVIVGDVHGDYAVLAQLLRRLGVIDDQGIRQPGFHTIQLGDYIDGAYRGVPPEWDWHVLERAETWFDVLLVGNHEPWWAFDLKTGKPGPYNAAPPPYPARNRQMLRRLWRTGRLRVAYSTGPWLLTHGGVHREHLARHPKLETAAQWDEYLNQRFREHLVKRGFDPIFDSDGLRSTGGIFWCHLPERSDESDESVPQIVGHSHGARPYKFGPAESWCVADTSGDGVCALLSRRSGGWSPVFTRYGRSTRHLVKAIWGEDAAEDAHWRRRR
jgi:hypothetical protein